MNVSANKRVMDNSMKILCARSYRMFIDCGIV